MTGVLKFHKNCEASLEKCWRLPHNLVFVLQVENGDRERENGKYFWHYSTDFLQTFVTCWPIQPKFPVIIFTALDQCQQFYLYHLVNFNQIWTTMMILVCDKNIMSVNLECVGQGGNSYKSHISTIMWQILTSISQKWLICDQQSNSFTNYPWKYMPMSQFPKIIIVEILFDLL